MEIITAQKAISLINDNCNLGIGGFNAFGVPEALLKELEDSYETKGSPKDLTIVAGVAPGDLQEDGGGLSHLKKDGCVKAVIASHIGMPPAIGRAIAENKISGVLFPLGIYTNLLRARAANRPGVISRVGIHTYADPLQDGCCVNELAKAGDYKPVERLKIDGEDILYYRTFPVDMCLLRGTYADENGNISMDEEGVLSEALEMAAAVHNNGGTVFVQVKQILTNGMIPAKQVYIPGKLVDYVIPVGDKYHPQGLDEPNIFRPELCGNIRVPTDTVTALKFDLRKIIARRAAMELREGALINLGIGIPAGVSSVANEEGLSAMLAVESGIFGGVPVGGIGLGASVNADAICHIADNFDIYDGGGLDMAFLGAAEIDRYGNVNVSKFGSHCTGPGGFIDITQNTKEVYFLGTFTAGKIDWEIRENKLYIVHDGSHVKWKNNVEQITFSAEQAQRNGQKILYITERCVFQLTEQGLVLTEIAPGIDIQRDILPHMEFSPIISDDLHVMDKRIFCPEKMQIRI